MKIEFSDHAKSRIAFRKISKRRVLAALNKPDKSIDSFKERLVFRKKFTPKVLEVVAKMEGDIMVVVTAYYLYEGKIRQEN